MIEIGYNAYVDEDTTGINSLKDADFRGVSLVGSALPQGPWTHL
jgi:hypothetical protein